VIVTKARITVTEVVVPTSLRQTCMRLRRRRVATASATGFTAALPAFHPRLTGVDRSEPSRRGRMRLYKLPAAGPQRGDLRDRDPEIETSNAGACRDVDVAEESC